MQAQSRDQLLSILWSEVSAAKAAGSSGTASAAAGSPHASPSGLLGVGASGLSALLEAEAGMDWADPTAQDRLLKAVTTVRVQVGTRLQCREALSLTHHNQNHSNLGVGLAAAADNITGSRRAVTCVSYTCPILTLRMLFHTRSWASSRRRRRRCVPAAP